MSKRLPTAPDFDAVSARASETATQRTKVLTLVGNLVFTWSNNESMFIYYLMLLLGTEFSSAAITFVSLNTTRARLDLVRRLAKTRCSDPVALRRLERLIERFNDCTKVRNDFNHCIYQLDEAGRITHTNVLRIIEDKQGIRFADLQELDEKRLTQLANTIKKLETLNRDLWSFLPQLETTLTRSGASGSSAGEPPRKIS